MTQPSTSNDRSFYAQSLSEQSEPIDSSAGSSHNASEMDNLKENKPALRHPNFDPAQTPIDPARSLADIPEPARRLEGQLQRLYGKSARFYQPKTQALSKWQLIASQPFAEHLDLLSAARLMELPASFYQRQDKDKPPLLSPLEHMTLLDLSDIQAVLRHYPTLSRYSFGADMDMSTDKNTDAKSAKTKPALRKNMHTDELLNSVYADDWQVILQPQDFEMGAGSLATDIMACSVAVHALKQCNTRKTINHSYSAAQICQHLRSYVLSQVAIHPAQQPHYRQIRVFTGHVIVAAAHLGWDMVERGDECYFNLSSRSALLTRYPNMQDYYINGWSS